MSQHQRQDAPNPQQDLVRVEENKKTLKVMLEQAGPQLAVMIPPKYRDVVSAERMALLALTTFSENEELQQCTLQSIVRALLKAARLGLEPDGQFGQGWLMAVWNRKKSCKEAQFRLGFQGRKTLAFRSGALADIVTEVVYEGDEFSESTTISPDGLAREFRHRPKRSKDRGGLVAAYAIAVFKDGTAPHLTVLDAFDVERIKKRSESLKGSYPQSSPWSTDEPEMWKKSAIGRLCKELPQPDPASQMALERDEAIDAGDYDGGDDADLPDEVVTTANRPQFVAPTIKVTPVAAPAAVKSKGPKAAPAPAQVPPPPEEPPFDAPVDAEFEEVPTAAAPAEAAPAPAPAEAAAPAPQGDLAVDIAASKDSAHLRKLGQFMAQLSGPERARVSPIFNAKMTEHMQRERAAKATEKGGAP